MQRDLPRVDDWEKLLRWLRGQRSLEGTIYAMNPRLSQMILLAGLNGAGPPRWIDLEFGVPQDRIDRRSVLLKELPRDPRAWRREGVSWFVVGPGEPVAPTVQAWVASRAARAVKAAGPWTIYHLEAPSR